MGANFGGEVPKEERGRGRNAQTEYRSRQTQISPDMHRDDQISKNLARYAQIRPDPPTPPAVGV